MIRSILTVTTPADSYDLTALATVKTELGITNTDSDAKLNTYIRQASSTLASYCTRVFASETVTETFRLTREEEFIQLLRDPVSAISNVVTGEGVNTTTLATIDYEYEAITGKIWRLDGADIRLTWTTRKVVVDYTAGYELLAGLPYEIERACVELVKLYHFSSTRDPYVRGEAVDGVGRIDYGFAGATAGAGIPPSITALVDPYRNIII